MLWFMFINHLHFSFHISVWQFTMRTTCNFAMEWRGEYELPFNLDKNLAKYLLKLMQNLKTAICFHEIAGDPEYKVIMFIKIKL